MIGELGLFCLILALVLSVVQSLTALIALKQSNVALLTLAKPLNYLHVLVLLLSFICLIFSFLANDFSLAYVAQNSNTLLPTQYKVSATWGGHEGSLLLWVLTLALWSTAAALFSRGLSLVSLNRALLVLGLLAVGFEAFVLFTSNPFARLDFIPAEGRDLNPLLQDPGLIFHPPMLYMGYVGYAITFAFAIAALLEGGMTRQWARHTRVWSLYAWIFLTCGIALGSWWAYYELGWGGWWFWDPVENASFMPWLAGTALMHALIISERRGIFFNWTVLLAILAFSLSLLGTFLVRSGVLTSVHAFATDPKRGVFILILLALYVGGALSLFAVQKSRATPLQSHWFSRESLLLTGNVLLIVACFTVLLATLYPLVLEVLTEDKISVGVPYFEAVFVPIMLPVLALMAYTPAVRWLKAQGNPVGVRLGAGVALVLGGLWPLAMGDWQVYTAISLALALLIIILTARHLWEFYRQRDGGNTLAALRLWGMAIAHIGVAVFVIGVTMVSSYEVEHKVKMAPGDHLMLGDYRLELEKIYPEQGPNYQSTSASFVLKNDQGEVVLAALKAEKRRYLSSAMPMTEAAIDSGLWRDVYVSISEPVNPEEPAGEWIISAQLKPFVNWIWFGCLIMSLGAFVAFFGRRSREAAL